MRKLSLSMTALGLLVSAWPAFADPTFADNTETLKLIKEIGSDAQSIAAPFSGAKGLWDVGIKVAEFLQLIQPDPTNADIMAKLEQIDDHVTAAYSGILLTDNKSYINQRLAKFTTTFQDLKDGQSLVDGQTGDYHDTREAANELFMNDDELFKRPKDNNDAALMSYFNSFNTLYTNADLGFDSTQRIYDWRVPLPALMLAVSWRIQFIAMVHPDFFVNPDNWGGVKLELSQYRNTFYKHYRNMVNGIRCSSTYDECVDIHSASDIKIPSGPEKWYWHAVHGALPIYELKALIDTLNKYIDGAAQADLAQNYHRLPGPLLGDVDPWCLHVKSKFSPSLVFQFLSFDLRACDGSTTQEWVYDRATGSVMNFGTLANPATGGCLGVAGGTHPIGARKSQLNLILTQCADPTKPYQADAHRHQQWTYDPQSKVLLNAMGTALSFYPDQNGGYSVRTEPYHNLMADNAAYAVSFGDSSTVQWQADHLIPGIPAFSDTMGPGETMHKGESRVSRNNRYELILGTDGNLVLYEKKVDKYPVERAVERWFSGTNGKNVDRVVLEGSGNLAIYPPSINCRKVPCNPPAPIWQTGTGGHTSSNLRVQDDGGLVIYDKQSKQIWPNWAMF